MKPTKEIIELSQKLREIGYRKEIEKGDWFINKYHKVSLCMEKERGYLCTLVLRFEKRSCIPIPSLEDGLLWLENYQAVQYSRLTVYYKHSEIVVEFHPEYRLESIIKAKSNTSHEAVLKAMVQVLEEK